MLDAVAGMDGEQAPPFLVVRVPRVSQDIDPRAEPDPFGPLLAGLRVFPFYFRVDARRIVAATAIKYPEPALHLSVRVEYRGLRQRLHDGGAGPFRREIVG